jgi:hypothetical protein
MPRVPPLKSQVHPTTFGPSSAMQNPFTVLERDHELKLAANELAEYNHAKP